MMASMININGSIDAYYRYKMPIPIIKYHKSTTQVENITNIAKALKRKPLYLERWFSKELSTQVKLDKNILVIKSKCDLKQINLCIQKFIKLLVLCSSCNNPETNIKIYSKVTCGLECLACGAVTKVKASNHSLVKFLCKDYIKPKEVTIQEESSSDCSDTDWCCDTSEDAVKARAKEFFQDLPNIIDHVVPDQGDDFIVFEDTPQKVIQPQRDHELDEFIDLI